MNVILIFQFAEMLMEKEVMNYKEIEMLLGPRPLGKKPDSQEDSKTLL